MKLAIKATNCSFSDPGYQCNVYQSIYLSVYHAMQLSVPFATFPHVPSLTMTPLFEQVCTCDMDLEVRVEPVVLEFKVLEEEIPFQLLVIRPVIHCLV